TEEVAGVGHRKLPEISAVDHENWGKYYHKSTTKSFDINDLWNVHGRRLSQRVSDRLCERRHARLDAALQAADDRSPRRAAGR
ncbi:MAG: hypothetical protein ACK5PW_20010, partial [Burkholderiales bacterium]